MFRGRKTLYLFTETYPFPGPDDPFLPDEVEELAKVFDLVLVPTVAVKGGRADLPSGVRTVSGLATYASGGGARLGSLSRAVFSAQFFREIGRQRPNSLRPRPLATIAVRFARAIRVEKWVRDHLLPEMEAGTSVCYSWWSFSAAYGVARALRGSGIPLVIRAHGYDLFAEQEAVGFVPFQRVLIENSTCCASASKAGADYLRSKYPDLAGKITTAYLGTSDPGSVNEPSTDGVLRILTCSSNTPVKRVDVLAQGLSVLARSEPDIDFRWSHIGSGPLADELADLIAVLPGLAGRCTQVGQLPASDVQEFLRRNHVDLFANTSFSEGLPVSLMEAASFGIPMMATAVGGNPEIVNESNGILLAKDTSPEQIAAAIAGFSRLGPVEKTRMRLASRATFEAMFNARINYHGFGQFLSEGVRDDVVSPFMLTQGGENEGS